MLAALAQECAPQVAPQTLTAIVHVESGGNPLAMWNNTTGQRILPTTLQRAQAYLAQAMAAGDKVDVGIAQVDTENFPEYGLTPNNAFDACTNLRVGAEILHSAYQTAEAHFGPGQLALYHAFEAYNSGQLWGDAHYANQVLRAAGLPVRVGSGGGLSYVQRPNMPLVFFVTSWGAGTKKGTVAQTKPVQGIVYAVNW